MKLFLAYLQRQLCWITQGQEYLLQQVSFHVANKKELKTWRMGDNVDDTREGMREFHCVKMHARHNLHPMKY